MSGRLAFKLLWRGGAACAVGAAGTLFLSQEKRQSFMQKLPMLRAAEAFNYNNNNENQYKSDSLLDPHGMTFPKSSWDSNWDGRQPVIVEETQPDSEDNSKTACYPTATRHIIMIRHGHYNLDGATDAEKKLTDLGMWRLFYENCIRDLTAMLPPRPPPGD